MPTAARLLSYSEWLQLPDNDDGREECVNGVIEKMPPATFSHAWTVKRLTRQRTPDIAVFILAKMQVRDGYFHSPPELATEVFLPSNIPARMRGPLADYSSIGVPEVWSVDPKERTVTLHRVVDDNYLATELPHDGATSPVRFPSVRVDFSAIWP